MNVFAKGKWPLFFGHKELITAIFLFEIKTLTDA
jgi:hypothetical protein